MMFGKYKKKGYEEKRVYLYKDTELEKWYAMSLTDRTYSQLFDSLEELREALRLYQVTWCDFRKHINMLCEARMGKAS